MAKQSKNLPAVAETETELEVLDAVPEAVSALRLGGLPVESPVDVLRQGAAVAKELAQVINNQGLFTLIQGRKYVHVEGWTTCSAMLGVTAREVSCEESEDGTFVAPVELVRCSDGMVIGRASHQCGGPDDNTWGQRERYTRRSMAVTRATGKACRLVFSWVIQLAGYAPTPAEEMVFNRDNDNGPQSPAPRPRKQVDSTAKTKAKVAEATPEPAPEPAKAKVTLPDSEILDPKIGVGGQDLMVIHSVTNQSSPEGARKPWKVYFVQARGSVTRFALGKTAKIQAEVRYATFDQKIADKLISMTDTNLEIGIDWEMARTSKGKGLRINSIMNADDVTANHGGSPDVVTTADIDKALDDDLPF